MRESNRSWRSFCVAASVVLVFCATRAWAVDGEVVQARIAADVAAGNPIVAHVVVALCDNKHQGIVPVPAQLGNGQDPRSNLYWGALYGLWTHFTRSAGWKVITTKKNPEPKILERTVFRAEVQRKDSQVPIYVVADAWDGAHIKETIRRFLAHAAGQRAETLRLEDGPEPIELLAGGKAHLVAYVGHNGLMDFSVPSPQRRSSENSPRSSLVLACASKEYFAPHLDRAGSHALLLTTGLMAPEAYTLDAAIRAWISEGTMASVVEAAAVAYDRYQNCGLGGARGLFWGRP